MAFIPTALLFIVSWFYPIYVERALLPSGVMYLTWVAWALERTGLLKFVKFFVLLVLVVGMGAGYIQHLTYQGFPYGPYSDLVKSLRMHLGTGDLILHSNKLTMLPSVSYDRSLPQTYINDPVESGSNTLALPTQKVLGLMALPSIESVPSSKNKIWFVIFKRAIEEYQAQGYDTHPHLGWLNSHYSLARIETWGDILIYEYTR
jgi:hypothetical protein